MRASLQLHNGEQDRSWLVGGTAFPRMLSVAEIRAQLSEQRAEASLAADDPSVLARMPRTAHWSARDWMAREARAEVARRREIALRTGHGSGIKGRGGDEGGDGSGGGLEPVSLLPMCEAVNEKQVCVDPRGRVWSVAPLCTAPIAESWTRHLRCG